jgi:hypothetical protein
MAGNTNEYPTLNGFIDEIVVKFPPGLKPNKSAEFILAYDGFAP